MTRLLLLLCIAVSVSTYAGSIKKWVDADGKVHFGDAPPAETQTNEIKVKPASGTPARRQVRQRPGSDYYSPQNQLGRLEARREIGIARQRARWDAERRRGERGKKAKVDAAECNYYEAMERKYKHRLNQGYKSKSDKLDDEVTLAQIKSILADQCE